MQTYIIRRLLLAIPTFLGASLVIFGLMRVLPGDIVLMILGEASAGNPYGVNVPDVERLRAILGLDKPIYMQYLVWMWDMARGDFGLSLRTQQSIGGAIMLRIPVTLQLALMGLFIAMLIAFPIGLLSALRQDSKADYFGRFFSILGLSIPEFWLGILAVLALLFWFHWIPPLEYATLLKNPGSNLQQFFIPALVLGVHTSAGVMRMLRSQMLEVIRQDYIRTAWAKGLREREVVVRHAMKNAIIPVVTLLGLRVGRLLAGTVILETIFNLPGMGRLLIDSINWRDLSTVQALVMIFTVSFIITNLVVDIAYAWLDPRIRYN